MNQTSPETETALERVQKVMTRLKETACMRSGQMDETLLYGLHGAVERYLASLGHAQKEKELVAYCGWHPDRGLNFATMADTQQGSTSRLMMTGISGNHGWSVVPLYAALSDSSTDGK